MINQDICTQENMKPHTLIKITVFMLFALMPQVFVRGNHASLAITLLGKVTGQGSTPIENATIEILNTTDNSIIASTTTDANGNYSLMIASAGVYHVKVTPPVASNYQPTTAQNQNISGNTTLDFTLIPISPTLSGKVAKQDSNPIAGAVIEVYRSSDNSYVTGASTDAQGNYSTKIQDTGTYNIKVKPPDGSDLYPTEALNQTISGDTTLNFTLTPLPIYTLNGRVLDAVGDGMAGISVQINRNGYIYRTLSTDSSGSYSTQLPEGYYLLFVSGYPAPTARASYYFALYQGSLALNQNTTIDFPLPFKWVSIRVEDRNHNPVANMPVEANVSQAGTLVFNGVSFFTQSYYLSNGAPKTDANGNATMWLLPNGYGYNFTVSPPSGSPFATTGKTQPITSDDSVTITLNDTAMLSGRVVDAEGNGLPGQAVSIARVGSYATNGLTTDSNGSYTIQLPLGDYTISVGRHSDVMLNAPTYYSVGPYNNSKLSLTQDTVFNFALPFKKVVVRIEDRNHNPVANARVYTDQPNNLTLQFNGLTYYGYSSYGFHSPYPATTDANGNAIMWLIPNEGNLAYTFSVIPPYADSSAQTSKTKAITTDDSFTITLTDVTLSGKVFDAVGNALANQSVSIYKKNESYPVKVLNTDSTGAYQTYLSPGEYRVDVSGGSLDPLVSVPNYYNLSSSYNGPHLTLVQDTSFNFTLPFKRVVVHVENQNHHPVANTIIRTDGGWNDSLSVNGLPYSGYSYYYADTSKTDADGNVTLWLFPNPNGSAYTFTAVPPSGGVSARTRKTHAITGDDSFTITLNDAVMLSGRVLDGSGRGMSGQTVNITSLEFGDAQNLTTGSNGEYSIKVSPGDYYIYVYGNGTGWSAPFRFDLYNNSSKLTLTSDTVFDFAIPFKRVTFHVQTPNGGPVRDVQVSSNQMYNNTMQFNGLPYSGRMEYGTSGVTDANGNAVLWLLPTENNPFSYYYFYAYPPYGSPFQSFNLNNVYVTDHKDIIVSLQYVHPAPVTTATLSPSPDGQGVYPKPVTVMLSATAHPGFSVTKTYYKVDNGDEQVYSAPFQVIGSGPHTLQFWSEDNVGVIELANTRNFTIAPDPTQTIVASSGSTTYGQAAMFTATVTSGGMLVTSGSVVFKEGNVVLSGAVNLDANGKAAFSTSALGAGSHTITAYFSGTPLFAASSGSIVQNVGKAALIVNVDGKTKAYGATNPTLTGTVTGVLSGDNITAAYTTTVTETTAAGTHTGAIDATLNDPLSRLINYAVTVNKGTFIVNKIALTVKADDKTKVYGTALPTFTASYSGFVNNEMSSVLGGTLSFTTTPTVTQSSTVGAYKITPAGLTSGNYNIAFVDGTLNITQANTTTMLSGSPSSPSPNQPITLIAAITPVTATGKVEFFEEAISLGKADVVSGIASLNLPGFTGGPHTLKAVYAGDTNHTGSQSADFVYNVHNTPNGHDVCVTIGNVTVCYTEVTVEGDTTVIPISPRDAGVMPPGYRVTGLDLTYDIRTTATYIGPVLVKIVVPASLDANTFPLLRVLHGENGQLVDRTVLAPSTPAPDFNNHLISARTSALSPFSVLQLQTLPIVASDQKAGAVLVFPYYTSDVSGNFAKSDTIITITNVSDGTATDNGKPNYHYLHLFFMKDCSPADTFVCLTPNGSLQIRASTYDPLTTGYLIAVAVDANGIPTQNNSFIGSAFVRDETNGIVDSYGAEAFAKLTASTVPLAGGNATLAFDGVNYEAVPIQVSAQIQDPAKTDQEIVLASLNGNLGVKMEATGQNSVGIVYRADEKPASFGPNLGNACLVVRDINNANIRITPGQLSGFLKESFGYVKLNLSAPAVGLLMNKQGIASGSKNRFSGIHALHTIATTGAILQLPVIPPSCQ